MHQSAYDFHNLLQPLSDAYLDEATGAAGLTPIRTMGPPPSPDIVFRLAQKLEWVKLR